MLLSGSLDKSVKIWDIEVGVNIRNLDGIKEGIYCMCAFEKYACFGGEKSVYI